MDEPALLRQRQQLIRRRQRRDDQHGEVPQEVGEQRRDQAASEGAQCAPVEPAGERQYWQQGRSGEEVCEGVEPGCRD